jgi:hypothetical protein
MVYVRVENIEIYGLHRPLCLFRYNQIAAEIRDKSDSRDRFYKAPFRPKNFSDEFSSSIFGQFSSQKTTDINYMNIICRYLFWIVRYFKATPGHNYKLKIDQIT